MNIDPVIYYKDDKEKFYCFNCAASTTTKIFPEIETKDTYNMPQCCKCGRYV